MGFRQTLNKLLKQSARVARPEPRFKIGDGVKVLPLEDNSEFYSVVNRIVWHTKNRTYNYYLNGKSKRYIERDLEPD